MMYASDYDQRVVPACNYNAGLGWYAADSYFYGLLQPYIKNRDIWFCSACPQANTYCHHVAIFLGYSPSSKCIPPWSNNGWGGGLIKTVTLAQAARPSETICTIEYTWDEPYYYPSPLFSSGDYWNNIPGYPWETYYPPPHMGRHNCVFADGHAKAVSPQSFTGRMFCFNDHPEPGWTNVLLQRSPGAWLDKLVARAGQERDIRQQCGIVEEGDACIALFVHCSLPEVTSPLTVNILLDCDCCKIA